MERQSVLDIFKNKCFICGYENFLDIHHIIHRKNRGDNDISNLVVLCPNHHKEWHYIENTFYNACNDARKNASERTHKALKMDYEIIDDVLNKKYEPYIKITNERITENRNIQG